MAEWRELLLDARRWNKPDDLYDAFFSAVGAPPWHGRNFNAIRDSVSAGHVNAIEVPYRIVLRNADKAGSGASAITSAFLELISELKAGGCPVDIRVENAPSRHSGDNAWPHFVDERVAVRRWTNSDGTRRVYLVARSDGLFSCWTESFSDEPDEMCWVDDTQGTSLFDSADTAVAEIHSRFPWSRDVEPEHHRRSPNEC